MSVYNYVQVAHARHMPLVKYTSTVLFCFCFLFWEKLTVSDNHTSQHTQYSMAWGWAANTDMYMYIYMSNYSSCLMYMYVRKHVIVCLCLSGLPGIIVWLFSSLQSSVLFPCTCRLCTTDNVFCHDISLIPHCPYGVTPTLRHNYPGQLQL